MDHVITIIEALFFGSLSALAVIKFAGPQIFKWWADKDLQRIKHEQEKELKRIQNIGEKDIYNYKLRFDKEFEIYQELWSTFFDLLSSAIQLRPARDYIDPKVSEEDIKNERLDKYRNASNNFVNIFEKNRPFYDPGIYEIANKIFHIATKEAIHYAHKKIEFEDYEVSEKNIKKLLQYRDDLCEAIRNYNLGNDVHSSKPSQDKQENN